MLKRHSVFSYLCVFASLLLLWQLLAALMMLPFIPSPVTVLRNICRIFFGDMLIHVMYSLWRVFAGILVSMAIGIPLGLCMGYYRAVDRFLSPAVYFTYPIPKIALIPLIMLFFGLGEVSKIVMITLIIVFQILVASRDAVKGIPKETYYSLQTLGAGSLDIFRRIILPASLPGLLTSLRVSLGTALSVLFFSETFGTQYGMGYFIMDSWMRVNYIDMFSGIAVLSFMGFFLFLVIDVLEVVVCPWKQQ